MRVKGKIIKLRNREINVRANECLYRLERQLQYYLPRTVCVHSLIMSFNPPHMSSARGDGQNKERYLATFFKYLKYKQ